MPPRAGPLRRGRTAPDGSPCHLRSPRGPTMAGADRACRGGGIPGRFGRLTAIGRRGPLDRRSCEPVSGSERRYDKLEYRGLSWRGQSDSTGRQPESALLAHERVCLWFRVGPPTPTPPTWPQFAPTGRPRSLGAFSGSRGTRKAAPARRRGLAPYLAPIPFVRPRSL